MSKNFNLNTDNEETWLTPPTMIESLGDFDLDPAVPVMGMPKTLYPNGYIIKETYNINDDGLKQSWDGKRVWCNPPYGRDVFKWFEKMTNSKGVTGVFLIFARTETKGFYEHIWCNPKVHSVTFLKGRVKFANKDGVFNRAANAPSCLISFSKYDTDMIKFAIQSNKLNGKVLKLENDDE